MTEEIGIERKDIFVMLRAGEVQVVVSDARECADLEEVNSLANENFDKLLERLKKGDNPGVR